MKRNTENSIKIGVVIGAYDRDVEYIGELCKSLKACGHYVVLCYDANRHVPNADTVNSCDVFISGGTHKVRPPGHLRNMQRGHRELVAHGCEYSLSLTGDALIEMPEAIPGLIEMLDGMDVIAAQWNGSVSTMINFGKTQVMNDAFQAMPPGHPKNEVKLTKALEAQGADYKIYPCRKDDKGIWATIGFSRRSENYPPG